MCMSSCFAFYFSLFTLLPVRSSLDSEKGTCALYDVANNIAQYLLLNETPGPVLGKGVFFYGKLIFLSFNLVLVQQKCFSVRVSHICIL